MKINIIFTLTFTFRVFGRLFYPKPLTHKEYICQKRDSSIIISLVVDKDKNKNSFQAFIIARLIRTSEERVTIWQIHYLFVYLFVESVLWFDLAHLDCSCIWWWCFYIQIVRKLFVVAYFFIADRVHKLFHALLETLYLAGMRICWHPSSH